MTPSETIGNLEIELDDIKILSTVIMLLRELREADRSLDQEIKTLGVIAQDKAQGVRRLLAEIAELDMTGEDR